MDQIDAVTGTPIEPPATGWSAGGDRLGITRLPASFYQALERMGGWLASLENCGSDLPSEHDSAALQSLFEDLWRSTGMDATLGLARGTPDHELLRAKLGHYFCRSPQLQRCFEKPRGYAGDYLMMDAVCNEPPAASTALGRWLDHWFYDTFPPFLAVRNRRDYMARLLEGEHTRGSRRVLNVACGGAPELGAARPCGVFEEIVLLDQDPEALKFACRTIEEKTSPTARRINPVCASIHALIQAAAVPMASGEYDLIYSMGLFDYLPHARARKLTRILWDRLAPGGLLVVGNFHGHHWSRYVIEGVMDWFLIYRDAHELRALAADLAAAHCTVIDDATGLLHLLHLRKP